MEAEQSTWPAPEVILIDLKRWDLEQGLHLLPAIAAKLQLRTRTPAPQAEALPARLAGAAARRGGTLEQVRARGAAVAARLAGAAARRGATLEQARARGAAAAARGAGAAVRRGASLEQVRARGAVAAARVAHVADSREYSQRVVVEAIVLRQEAAAVRREQVRLRLCEFASRVSLRQLGAAAQVRAAALERQVATAARFQRAAALLEREAAERREKAEVASLWHERVLRSAAERRGDARWAAAARMGAAAARRRRYVEQHRLAAAQLDALRGADAREILAERSALARQQLQQRLSRADARRKQVLLARRQKGGERRLREQHARFQTLQRQLSLRARLDHRHDSAARMRCILMHERQADAHAEFLKVASIQLQQAQLSDEFARHLHRQMQIHEARRAASLSLKRSRAAVSSERVTAAQLCVRKRNFHLACRIEFAMMGSMRNRRDRLDAIQQRAAKVVQRHQQVTAARAQALLDRAQALDVAMAAAAHRREVFLLEKRAYAERDWAKVLSASTATAARSLHAAARLTDALSAAAARRAAAAAEARARADDAEARRARARAAVEGCVAGLATRIQESLATTEARRVAVLAARAERAAELSGRVSPVQENAASAAEQRASVFFSKLETHMEAAEAKRRKELEVTKSRAAAVVAHHEKVVAAKKRKEEEEKDELANRLEQHMLAATQRRLAFVAARRMPSVSTPPAPPRVTTASVGVSVSFSSFLVGAK